MRITRPLQQKKQNFDKKKSTNNNKTNGIQISINYYGQNKKKLKIITQNINKKKQFLLNNNKKNLIKNKIPFKKRKIPNSL